MGTATAEPLEAAAADAAVLPLLLLLGTARLPPPSDSSWHRSSSWASASSNDSLCSPGRGATSPTPCARLTPSGLHSDRRSRKPRRRCSSPTAAVVSGLASGRLKA